MQDKANSAEQSFIPASESLPEITIKAVILSIILTIALAAANAYLGLKVGTTVSASIPAAVISMAILRLFRQSNILENNIVQTAASAGEALVAGVTFIMPALILLHFWTQFNYWETVAISISGGFLGVLFSVFLRRVLLAEKTLRFPEGTAIGNVLKASAMGGRTIKHLIHGTIVGGLISFCQTGLEFISGSVQYWFRVDNAIVGFGSGFDPALIAAGYIVGINVALSILLGVVVGWVLGVPYFSFHDGITQPNNPAGSALDIWHTHLRYVGVGMMLVGGIWTLVTFLKPMVEGIRTSFTSLKIINTENAPIIPRTERDLPVNYALWLILLVSIPIAMIFWHYTGPAQLALSHTLRLSIVIIGVLFALTGGFLFSSICGYFTGLVGSTNNPLSGMTLCALIIVSLTLYAILSPTIHFATDTVSALHASALAIIIGGVIGSAAAITNDTIQDLKAGQMVGATPWKQQFMLMVGTAVAALVIPLILNLLFNAYGIGGVFPRAGMDPKQMLAAPQAGLMTALVQGVFGHHLPWEYIQIGFVFALICVVIDTYLKKHNRRLPVLAVALGVYLPLDASVPLAIGGVLSWLVEHRLQKQYAAKDELTQNNLHEAHQRGLILACGIVAGAALMGVILAIPFALAQSSDVLKIVSDGFTPIANVLGIAVTAGLLIWVYRVVCRKP
jgi:putative OPT family oligopeptide transporter